MSTAYPQAECYHSEGFECAYPTCHHPLPEPPSQSEHEVAGLRGPQGPSDMSDCCCSCQGNQGRQCDRMWRFLSSLHRMLHWRKETVKKTERRWKAEGELCKMQWPSTLAGGFGGKSKPLQGLHHYPLDCSWITSAHLVECVSQELCGAFEKNAGKTLSIQSSCRKM